MKDIWFLINFLKENSNIDKIRYIEENKDLQFLALKKLYENKKFSNENYLYLILANSLVCYQLSGKWEQYWEEFSNMALQYFNNDFWKIDIIWFFEFLFKNWKYNKRFVSNKLKRINKFLSFYEDFFSNAKQFYYDMKKLNKIISQIMNQKENSKTIVFSIKMFGYGGRLVYKKFISYPMDIYIPIDSRLTKLYEIYWKDFEDINQFYKFLLQQIQVPPLHLDSILWVNFDYLI